MTEVSSWLAELGLQQYAGIFDKEEIDFSRLVNLSEQDLRELGLPLVPRQTVLRELTRLGATTTSSGTAVAGLSPSAERRQLTIMFSDLVDSVALSTRLDLEDLRDVMTAYHRTCAEAVRGYGGYVARYLGDGVLAYFGFPTAHEDDAERAVRAGIDLVGAVGRLNGSFDVDLRVRVGIATGLVVIGNDVAGNPSDGDGVAGETVNLASRLQTLAAPDTVVVSAVTRQLGAERFEYRDLGPQELKGFAQPVSAYQVIRETQVSRLAARNAATTPFVGRGEELELLLENWSCAKSGEGRVVVIAGEAGIGKSRIVAEACARVRDGDTDRAQPLLFQCSPYHVNASLFPITRELERIAGISRSAMPYENTARLWRFLAGQGLEGSLPALEALLGLAADEHSPLARSGSVARRSLTLAAVSEWLASHAKVSGSILIFEDVQWLDPTTKLLLARTIDWARNAPVLVAVTLRTDHSDTTEFLKDLGLAGADGRLLPHACVCTIGELPSGDARELAIAAAEGRAITDRQLDAVVERSEGIPLYVEELTKSVVSGADLTTLAEAADQQENVPNTLRDALMAQLDQLGHAKNIAQHASVLGQDISLALLATVTRNPVDEVAADLQSLVAARILTQPAGPPDTYRFRHALVRDIAYRSLLRRTRRQIHFRVGNALAGRPAEAADTTDDVIAQHYSLGESYPEAIRFWQSGAKNAIGRSAHQEALAMLQAAQADLRKLPAEAWLAVELELVMAEAVALRSIRGYSAPAVEERLRRARELCIACADSSNRFNVEWGLFQCTIVKRDIEGARQLASDLFDHAERHPDRPLVDAFLANGMVALNAGDFLTARDLLEKGVSLSRPDTDQPHFFTHGQNPGLFCLSYLARALCFLGYLDRGRETIGRCLAVARNRADDRGHTYGNVNALMHAVRVYNLCGDVEAERRLAMETNEIARRNHYAYYEAVSTCHLGWTAGALGDAAQGIETMLSGLAALERTATSLALPGFYVLLAQLYIRQANWFEAGAALRKASETGEHAVWAADAERVRGDLLASCPEADRAGAEAAYRTSIAIARKQNAGLLVFKAGINLAQLLRGLGRDDEAHETLGTCFAALHEGFDVPDARHARTLMNSLANSGR